MKKQRETEKQERKELNQSRLNKSDVNGQSVSFMVEGLKNFGTKPEVNVIISYN